MWQIAIECQCRSKKWLTPAAVFGFSDPSRPSRVTAPGTGEKQGRRKAYSVSQAARWTPNREQEHMNACRATRRAAQGLLGPPFLPSLCGATGSGGNHSAQSPSPRLTHGPKACSPLGTGMPPASYPVNSNSRQRPAANSRVGYPTCANGRCYRLHNSINRLNLCSTSPQVSRLQGV
jgi:hypothetical protein